MKFEPVKASASPRAVKVVEDVALPRLPDIVSAKITIAAAVLDGSFPLFETPAAKDAALKLKVHGLNDSLARAQKSESEIGRILTYVRCALLKLSLPELEAATSVSRGTLLRLESHKIDGTKFVNGLSELLKLWERLCKQEDTSENVRPVLEMARSQVLQEVQVVYGEGMAGLLRRWQYHAGNKKFSEQGFPADFFTQLRSGERFFAIYDLVKLGKKLGVLESGVTPRELWGSDECQVLFRTFEKAALQQDRTPVITDLECLLALDDKAVKGRVLVGDKDFGLSELELEALSQYRLLVWETVEPIFSHLRSVGILSDTGFEERKDAWELAYKQREPTAEELLQIQLEKRNLENTKIAELLGVDSTKIYEALYYRRTLRELPIARLGLILCSSKPELEKVLTAKFEDLKRAESRAHRPDKPDIYYWRRVWGVERNELPGVSAAELENFEIHGDSRLQEQEADLIVKVVEIGEKKTRGFLEQYLDIYDVATVQALIDAAISIYTPGGLGSRTGLGRVPILNLQKGAFCTREQLDSIGKVFCSHVPPSVVLDWNEKLAQEVQAESDASIYRIMRARVAFKVRSETTFLREHGLAWKHETIFTRAQRNGRLDSTDFNRISTAFAVPVFSPLSYLFKAANQFSSPTMALRQLGRDLHANHEAKTLDAIKKLAAILAKHGTDLRCNDRSTHSVSDLFYERCFVDGLTLSSAIGASITPDTLNARDFLAGFTNDEIVSVFTVGGAAASSSTG